MNPALQNLYDQAGFMLLKILGAIILVAIVIGLITYGRPVKFSKKNSPLEDLMDLIILITHSLIDWILYKLRGNKTKDEVWLNDRQLLNSIRRMKPQEFEVFVADLFSSMGYKSTVIGGRSDGGIDVRLLKDGREHIVQCKKYITRKVTPHDVRDFYGALAGQHIEGKGFFVTTHIFTVEAEQFAKDKPLELIDGQRLIKLVRNFGPKQINTPADQKTVDTTEPLPCPKCGGQLIIRTRKRDGGKFLGCSNFPKCRHVKSL